MPRRPSGSVTYRCRVRQRSPVHVARHRLDDHVQVQPGQPGQLLAHDVGLEQPLAVEVHVLEVAAAAQARSGDRAGGGYPVR